MKTLALVLVIVLLAGCATTGAGDGWISTSGRPVTATQKDTDAADCRQTGLLIGSIPLFLLLVIPGIVMVAVAGAKERSCMAERGYKPVTG